MTVIFCGHRHCPDSPELRSSLVSCVKALIAEGADKFCLGGYGDFDRITASVVWELKGKYPQIESVLVLAYLGREVNTDAYAAPPVRLDRTPWCTLTGLMVHGDRGVVHGPGPRCVTR